MARNSLDSLAVALVPEDSTASYVEYTFYEDGAAMDLSSATGSLYFHAKTVDGVSVVSDQAAAWTTDGSDGKIRTQMNSSLVGDPRDLYCEFEVQGYDGGNLISDLFILRVTARAKVS